MRFSALPLHMLMRLNALIRLAAPSPPLAPTSLVESCASALTGLGWGGQAGAGWGRVSTTAKRFGGVLLYK